MYACMYGCMYVWNLHLPSSRDDIHIGRTLLFVSICVCTPRVNVHKRVRTFVCDIFIHTYRLGGVVFSATYIRTYIQIRRCHIFSFIHTYTHTYTHTYRLGGVVFSAARILTPRSLFVQVMSTLAVLILATETLRLQSPAMNKFIIGSLSL